MSFYLPSGMEYSAVHEMASGTLKIFARTPDGSCHSVNTVTATPRAPGALMMPLLELDQSGAQKLLDALWTTGLRPTGGDRPRSEGESRLISTITEMHKEHVGDLRNMLHILLRQHVDAMTTEAPINIQIPGSFS